MPAMPSPERRAAAPRVARRHPCWPVSPSSPVRWLVPVLVALVLFWRPALGQQRPAGRPASPASPAVTASLTVTTSPGTNSVGQPNDEEYTRRIREYLRDPRIKIKKAPPYLMDVEGAAQTYVF